MAPAPLFCMLFVRRSEENPVDQRQNWKDDPMFAVIKTGGKQYKVTENELIDVEKLDAETGKKIKIKEVLMVGEGADVKVGDPLVAGAEVTVEVVDQRRDRKVVIFKKKRRQN